MSLFAWIMVGLAIWHFTIFLPDRYWGGIVGAFLGAIIGAALFGLVVNGFSIPGRDDTTIGVVLVAAPGAILGVAAMYFAGVRQEATRPAA